MSKSKKIYLRWLLGFEFIYTFLFVILLLFFYINIDTMDDNVVGYMCGYLIPVTYSLISIIISAITYKKGRASITQDDANLIALLSLLTLNVAAAIGFTKLSEEELKLSFEKKDNFKTPTSHYSTNIKTTEDRRIEYLEKYKDYLDKGLITQEEYEAKKKQILGL